MFEIDTQVVCVDDKFPDGINDFYNALPVKGKLYVVRDVVPGNQFDLTETCAILLVELVNKPNPHGIEPGFLAHRFVEPEELEEYEKRKLKEGQPKKKVEKTKESIGKVVKAPKKRELVEV